ncbi:MAG: 6-phosphogluconolactonase [Flavobacteriales bacterium]
MKTLKFKSKENLEADLSAYIIDALTYSISKNDSASILLSGGSTPKGLFAKLAKANIDWSKVKIGLVDDRMVNHEDQYSNALLLRNFFIKNIKSTPPAFYPLVFNPEEESSNMDDALESVQSIGNPDIVILGMGGDGHFASLFPNDKNSALGLSLISDSNLIYTKAPDYPHKRISHSWNYLRKANHLIIFITGESKLEIIKNEERNDQLPIDTILNDRGIEPILYWAP